MRAYGRDWSGHPIDRLRTWRAGTPAVPAGRDLSRSDAYAVQAGATATLNVHGDQDGFTMRTFEACGVGGVQLIDRADVERYFDPGHELVVFSGADQLVEQVARLRRDPARADRIRQAGRRRALAEHTFAHRVEHLEARWD